MTKFILIRTDHKGSLIYSDNDLHDKFKRDIPWLESTIANFNGGNNVGKFTLFALQDIVYVFLHCYVDGCFEKELYDSALQLFNNYLVNEKNYTIQ